MTPKACNQCRKRKGKCGGENGLDCLPCKNHKTSCTWEVVGKRRRPRSYSESPDLPPRKRSQAAPSSGPEDPGLGTPAGSGAVTSPSLNNALTPTPGPNLPPTTTLLQGDTSDTSPPREHDVRRLHVHKNEVLSSARPPIGTRVAASSNTAPLDARGPQVAETELKIVKGFGRLEFFRRRYRCLRQKHRVPLTTAFGKIDKVVDTKDDNAGALKATIGQFFSTLCNLLKLLRDHGRLDYAHLSTLQGAAEDCLHSGTASSEDDNSLRCLLNQIVQQTIDGCEGSGTGYLVSSHREFLSRSGRALNAQRRLLSDAWANWLDTSVQSHRDDSDDPFKASCEDEEIEDKCLIPGFTIDFPPIHIALAGEGLDDEMILLKADETTANVTDYFERNMLHVAVERQNYDFVRQLRSIDRNRFDDLKSGTDCFRLTPLAIAIMIGDLVMFDALQHRTDDPKYLEHLCYEMSILEIAVDSGQYDITKRMLHYLGMDRRHNRDGQSVKIALARILSHERCDLNLLHLVLSHRTSLEAYEIEVFKHNKKNIENYVAVLNMLESKPIAKGDDDLNKVLESVEQEQTSPNALRSSSQGVNMTPPVNPRQREQLQQPQYSPDLSERHNVDPRSLSRTQAPQPSTYPAWYSAQYIGTPSAPHYFNVSHQDARGRSASRSNSVSYQATYATPTPQKYRQDGQPGPSTPNSMSPDRYMHQNMAHHQTHNQHQRQSQPQRSLNQHQTHRQQVKQQYIHQQQRQAQQIYEQTLQPQQIHAQMCHAQQCQERYGTNTLGGHPAQALPNDLVSPHSGPAQGFTLSSFMTGPNSIQHQQNYPKQGAELADMSSYPPVNNAPQPYTQHNYGAHQQDGTNNAMPYLRADPNLLSTAVEGNTPAGPPENYVFNADIDQSQLDPNSQPAFF